MCIFIFRSIFFPAYFQSFLFLSRQITGLFSLPFLLYTLLLSLFPYSLYLLSPSLNLLSSSSSTLSVIFSTEIGIILSSLLPYSALDLFLIYSLSFLFFTILLAYIHVSILHFSFLFQFIFPASFYFCVYSPSIFIFFLSTLTTLHSNLRILPCFPPP